MVNIPDENPKLIKIEVLVFGMVTLRLGFRHCRERSIALFALQVVGVQAQYIGRITNEAAM